jgi:hypothetical protein
VPIGSLRVERCESYVCEANCDPGIAAQKVRSKLDAFDLGAFELFLAAVVEGGGAHVGVARETCGVLDASAVFLGRGDARGAKGMASDVRFIHPKPALGRVRGKCSGMVRGDD